jgi:hypothetical protein
MQVIIKENGNIHVPALGGHVIEAAPMDFQWSGLQTPLLFHTDNPVGDEQVGLPLQC